MARFQLRSRRRALQCITLGSLLLVFVAAAALLGQSNGGLGSGMATFLSGGAAGSLISMKGRPLEHRSQEQLAIDMMSWRGKKRPGSVLTPGPLPLLSNRHEQRSSTARLVHVSSSFAAQQ